MRLSLSQQLHGISLTESLPTESALEFLFLGEGTTSHTGLRGLQHWSSLKELSLGPLATPLTPADWQTVAALPCLTRLHVNGRIVTHSPGSISSMPELPEIDFLRVPSLYGAEDLSLLASRLPGLRQVILQTYPDKHLSADLYAHLFPQATVDVVRR